MQKLFFIFFSLVLFSGGAFGQTGGLPPLPGIPGGIDIDPRDAPELISPDMIVSQAEIIVERLNQIESQNENALQEIINVSRELETIKQYTKVAEVPEEFIAPANGARDLNAKEKTGGSGTASSAQQNLREIAEYESLTKDLRRKVEFLRPSLSSSELKPIEKELIEAEGNMDLINRDIPQEIQELSTALQKNVTSQEFSYAECKLFPTWAGCVKEDNVVGPVGKANDGVSLIELLRAIAKILVRLAVPLAFAGVVYAGYMFIAGSSNEENITNAKGYFTSLLIGVGLILIAYSVVQAIYFFFVQ